MIILTYHDNGHYKESKPHPPHHLCFHGRKPLVHEVKIDHIMMMVTMRMLMVMMMMMVVVVMYNDGICMINNQQLCAYDDHHKLRFGLPNPYLSPGLAQVQHEIDIINMQ